jgi:tripartite-type tricarboxylate transporter receptor subunit TctC
MIKCPGVAIKAALVLAHVLAVMAVLVPGTAGADNYPERPVRIIVPIGSGGSYDFVGRLLASKLTELMGQTFFVENRTGAGTLVGTQSAAAATPDGYTLLIGGLSNMAFNFALYQKVGYELSDFVPIAVVYTFPYVMVARSDLPQRNLAEIISYGRQSPGKLTTGTSMIEVPYRTIRGAYVDMLAGRVDLMFDSAAAAFPYITAKKVRGIALLAPERYRTVPDLPTIAEAGLNGLGIESWIGLFAPAGTPPEVLDKLRSTTRVAAEDLKAQFENSGGGLMQMPVADTDKFIKSEYELWTRVIRDAGIHLD